VPDPRRLPDDRPTSGSIPLAEELRALGGEEMPGDQDAVLDLDEIETEPETTDTERYLGEADRQPRPVNALSAATELRDGETDDPYVASDEGLTYVPPTDPPTRPSDDPEGIEVAAGTASSSLDEPYDADHHGEAISTESEVTARIREALEADAATSELADRIGISTLGGTVILRGTVDTIDDGDALVEVASRVSGVADVRDETVVAGL
jgi:BON domain-containing protein